MMTFGAQETQKLVGRHVPFFPSTASLNTQLLEGAIAGMTLGEYYYFGDPKHDIVGDRVQGEIPGYGLVARFYRLPRNEAGNPAGSFRVTIFGGKNRRAIKASNGQTWSPNHWWTNFNLKPGDTITFPRGYRITIPESTARSETPLSAV